MKKYIIVGLFLFAGLSVYGQNYESSTSDLDTLAANAADTVTISTDKAGAVFYYVNGLKISGNPGGTISYQVSGNGGTTYSTVATDTITNGTTNQFYQLDKFVGNRARCIVTANGTTQSGSYRICVAFKRD